MSGPPASDRAAERFSGRTLIALAALSVVFVVIAWAARQPGITAGNDDARYMLLARALREGTYRDLYRVGQGWHSLYPPGYPALLAVVGGLFGESHDLFIALNILLSLVAMLLVADVARKLWSPAMAVAVFALGVFNYGILFHITTWVMSEGLYMALSALALWAAAERLESPRRMWLAGASACLAALTRSIGVTLIAGLALTWLVQRRWKAAATLAVGAALSVGPWLVWTAKAPVQFVGRSYVADAQIGVGPGGSNLVSTLLQRIRDNGVQYAARDIPDALGMPTLEGTVLDNLFVLALWGGLGVLGLVAVWRRWPAMAWYCACYGGLLLVWPFHQIRFISVVMPFFLFAVMAGAWEVGRLLGRGRELAPVGIVAAALSIVGVVGQMGFVGQQARCDRSLEPPSLGCLRPEVGSFVEAARFARTGLPPGTAVAVGKDASFAFLSDHPVVPAASLVGAPPEYVRERMREVGVQYLFVGLVYGEDFRLAETLLPLCDEVVVVGAFEPSSYLLTLPDAETLDGFSGGSPGRMCGPLAEAAQGARAHRPER